MSTSDVHYHHGNLSRALLKEGTALINDKGHDKLSMRELARRTGVSPMAAYRHYADKDSLLAAIAADGFLQLTAKLKAVDDTGGDDRSPLLQAGIAYVMFALEQPALFRLMFTAHLAGSSSAELKTARADSFNVLMRHIEPRERGGEGVLSAYGCWSLVHGLGLLLLDGWLQVPGDVEADEWLEQIIVRTMATRAEPE